MNSSRRYRALWGALVTAVVVAGISPVLWGNMAPWRPSTTDVKYRPLLDSGATELFVPRRAAKQLLQILGEPSLAERLPANTRQDTAASSALGVFVVEGRDYELHTDPPMIRCLDADGRIRTWRDGRIDHLAKTMPRESLSDPAFERWMVVWSEESPKITAETAELTALARDAQQDSDSDTLVVPTLEADELPAVRHSIGSPSAFGGGR